MSYWIGEYEYADEGENDFGDDLFLSYSDLGDPFETVCGPGCWCSDEGDPYGDELEDAENDPLEEDADE